MVLNWQREQSRGYRERDASQMKRVELLKDRALMLQSSRNFFIDRGVVELDCPALNATANIDDSIDPIEVQFCESKKGFFAYLA